MRTYKVRRFQGSWYLTIKYNNVSKKILRKTSFEEVMQEIGGRNGKSFNS